MTHDWPVIARISLSSNDHTTSSSPQWKAPGNGGFLLCNLHSCWSVENQNRLYEHDVKQ